MLANAERFVSLLLRYVVAGGTAVLAFGSLETPRFTSLKLGAPADISIGHLALLVFVVGPGIYSIHRAALHPILRHCVLWMLRNRLSSVRTVSELKRTISDKTLNLGVNADPWARVYDAWSAELHFLYCSSWGLLAAYGLHWLAGTQISSAEWHIGWAAIGVLMTSAIIGDWRQGVHVIERIKIDAS